MPFDDAVNYLQDSLARRDEEIKKGKKQMWFTSQVEDYEELFDKFGREEESAEWEAIKGEATDNVKYAAIKLKIGWLGGVMRDLRTLYVCGVENHPRAPQDDNRFTLCKIGFINFLLEKLKKSLE